MWILFSAVIAAVGKMNPTDSAEFSAAENFFDALIDGGRTLMKDNREYPVCFLSAAHQFFAFSDRYCHRFVEQQMFSFFQCADGHGGMQSVRRCDDHRIKQIFVFIQFIFRRKDVNCFAADFSDLFLIGFTSCDSGCSAHGRNASFPDMADSADQPVRD